MINPLDIIKQTEKAYHLIPGSLVNKVRTKTVSEARSVAMYLSHKLTTYSSTELGYHFERDHSTVLHNCKNMVKLVAQGGNNNTLCTIIKLINSFTSLKKG